MRQWSQGTGVAAAVILWLALSLQAADAAPDRFVERQRATLTQARVELSERLRSPGVDPVGALRRYTSSVDRVVRAVDRRIRLEIGPPPKDARTGKPVAYELFAMGSYARRELAPFSDLDYGILTASANRKVRGYFTRYARRVQGLMVEIDGAQRIRPCSGMSPTGRHGDALVDTVDRMAGRAIGRSRSLQARPLRERDYIQSALGSTRRVLGHGQARLHRRYLRTIHSLLRDNDRRAAVVERLLPSLRDPFGLPAAIADPIWSRGLAAPPQKNPEKAIRSGDVNIKHDILRVFQMPVNVFRTIHGIQAIDTRGVIRQMVRRGHLEASLGCRLDKVFTTAIRLRALRHLEHQSAEDRLGPLSQRQQRQIRAMVPVLKRLRRQVELATERRQLDSAAARSALERCNP